MKVAASKVFSIFKKVVRFIGVVLRLVPKLEKVIEEERGNLRK